MSRIRIQNEVIQDRLNDIAKQSGPLAGFAQKMTEGGAALLGGIGLGPLGGILAPKQA